MLAEGDGELDRVPVLVHILGSEGYVWDANGWLFSFTTCYFRFLS